MPNSTQNRDYDQLDQQHHGHVRNSQQQQQHDDHGHIRFSPEGKKNIRILKIT